MGECHPTDSICKAVMGQTLCGQYVHAAHALYAANGITTTIGIYSQPEIYWESTAEDSVRSICPTRAALLLQDTRLAAVKSALEAVMVISVMVGIVSGIAGPMYGKG